jgi:hypothetical protein
MGHVGIDLAFGFNPVDPANSCDPVKNSRVLRVEGF